jgi:hypothetical protein
LVTPTGNKWWRLKFRFGGKEKLLSLGVYLEITPLTLLTAQTDDAYRRFGSTDWAPCFIGYGDDGSDGISLRFAARNDDCHAVSIDDPTLVRLENRLPASDSDYFVAMAATVIGIDHALRRFVTAYPNDAVPLEAIDSSRFEVLSAGTKTLVVSKLGLGLYPCECLPATRRAALRQLGLGLTDTLAPLTSAMPLFNAVLDSAQTAKGKLAPSLIATQQPLVAAHSPANDAAARKLSLAGLTPCAPLPPRFIAVRPQVVGPFRRPEQRRHRF